MMADGDMYACSDAADMDTNADAGVPSRRAHQRQRENRSDQFFHGSFLG
jgi:hypothetical protein